MAERTIRTYLRVEVADAKRQLRDFAGEADRASAAFDASGKRIETTAGRMVRSAQVNAAEWRTVGQTLAVLGGAGVAALGASAAAAISWESAWAGVLKTVDGTATELERLEGGLRTMARSLPASHTEIAAVAEAAGQLGIRVNDVAAFTKVMIDLGETTNLSAEDAATGLARFSNVMGTAASDVDRLGATIVDLGNNYATTEREILEMSQRLAAAGKVVGLSESEVMALATAMSSVGIEAEAGGSAISRVMIAIAKSVDTGGERLDAFARAAGMSAEQFQAAWRQDAVGALVDVVGGLGNLTAAGEGAFEMLDELGLKEVRVTNAMLSMAAAGDLVSSAVDLANTAWDENTALVEEASKRYDTAEAKISMARNSITDAAIEMGSHLLPVLSEVAEAVAGVAEWFGNLPDPLQRAVTGLGGIASVAALGAGGLALMVPRALETLDAFQKIGAVSPRVATGLTRIGGAALRIGGAAAGIGLVGVALAKIAEASYMDRIDKGMGRVAESIAEASATANASALDGLFRDANGDDLIEGVNDLGSALERTFNKNWEQSFNDWGSNLMHSLTGVEGSTQHLEGTWSRMDQQLVDMVSGGHADQAAAVFEMIGDAALANGVSIERLNEIFPLYIDGLKLVGAEAQITATSTKTLSDDVDVHAERLERYYEAIGMTAEELQEWKDAAAVAASSFGNMLGAYDDVIAKNIEVAQSTANATKSAKDSWEDYYDGTSVSIKDFIANLEEQVAAQEAWEQNMLTIAGRVSPEMVTYLQGLGVEGAPMVEMIAGASDEDLSKIEGLFARSGQGAATAFAEELALVTFGTIPIEANTTPAIWEIEKVIDDYHNRVIELQVKANFEGGAVGDVVGRARDWLFSGANRGGSQYDEPLGPPAPSPFLSSPPSGDIWGNSVLKGWPTSLGAQASAFGTPAQPSGGTPMVLREHTVEQTTVNVDKLVAQDVEDFTEQTTALRRGAAIAGMRAVY